MFTLKNTKNRARHGELVTPHGSIQTPFFMPIATKGAVKSLSAEDMRILRAQVLLSNTYHLYLRPGLKDMKKLGGLHTLMRWDGPLLTDSGGYQVFSLGEGARDKNSVRITEEGVEFKSHIDGSKQFLSPKISMEMQAAIGADIFMQFDDVAAGNSTKERYQDAMERSLRWAKESKDAFETQGSAASAQLFAIVQGGIHEDLRERSATELVKIGFDGYAIGGLSVGEDRTDAFRIASKLTEMLPEDKPRYFMGGGFPEEIVYYVSIGVDMFDCVLPTRNARHGTLFTWAGDPSDVVPKAFEAAQNGATDKEIAATLYKQIIITNEPFSLDQSPIDEFALNGYSKAYLRHLFKVGEPLAIRLATIQNLRFYLRLMEELRAIIAK